MRYIKRLWAYINSHGNAYLDVLTDVYNPNGKR